MRRGALCIRFPKGSEAVGAGPPLMRTPARRHAGGTAGPDPRPARIPAAPKAPPGPRRRPPSRSPGGAPSSAGRAPGPARPALHGALTVWVLGAALRSALWPRLPAAPASFIRPARPARPARRGEAPAHLLGQWARRAEMTGSRRGRAGGREGRSRPERGGGGRAGGARG